MGFLRYPIICTQNKTSKQCTSPQRRRFIQFAGKTFTTLLITQSIGTSVESSDSSNVSSRWNTEDLCSSCGGRGRQTCSFCYGSGIFSIDDNLVQTENVCPNCQGNGSIRCPACIGLGLADVSGVLRDGARKGTLRMLRNGSLEILDCSAFPACDIFGIERRSQL